MDLSQGEYQNLTWHHTASDGAKAEISWYGGDITIYGAYRTKWVAAISPRRLLTEATRGMLFPWMDSRKTIDMATPSLIFSGLRFIKAQI